MELHQITIDEILHPGYAVEPQTKSGIYPKIDWLTMMFHDCSLYDVLEYFNQTDYVDTFVGSMYEKAGIQDNFVFVYNYIRIEIAKFYFYQQEPDTKVFDMVVPTIRVDLSGKALDYLRGCNFEFYDLRCNNCLLSYHITRCDWAFDFVNYCPDFMDKLIDHIQTHSLASGRVPLSSTHGAVKYSLKLGSEKTLYLGATKSDKLLRVYDKAMQLKDADTGLWKEEIPYDDPESWFRIELQTRNKTAHGLLMPGLDGQIREYIDILKYIFDSYAFADGTVDGNNIKREVVDFWYKLFPWNEVKKKIIQNANYVQPKSYRDKLDDYIDRTFPKIIQWLHVHGASAFEFQCQRYLKNISVYNDSKDPRAYKRRLAFYAQLAQLGVPVPHDGAANNGLFQICGELAFVWPEKKGSESN